MVDRTLAVRSGQPRCRRWSRYRRWPRDPRWPRERGATLIELVVALAILALVMSFLPGTLRLGQRIWAVGEALSADTAITAFERIASDRLAAARPEFERDQLTGRVALAFTGAPGRLSFIAESTVGPAGARLYRVEIDAVDQGTYVVPRLRLSPYGVRGEMQVAEHRSPTPVGHVVFRYFGAANGAAEPAWHRDWLGQQTLPRLVEVGLSRHPAGVLERHVVELKLGASR